MHLGKTMKQLILVDKNDKQIGQIGKLEAHLGRGRRHRAFTVILQNKQGEILLTKRVLQKPLWPTYWDLSFSSHPWAGESLETACQRRAKEELGIEIKTLKKLFKYQWQESWSNIFSEWEINHILLAKVKGRLKINKQEISHYQWLVEKKAKDWFKKNAFMIAPWVSLMIKNKQFIYEV